MFRVIALFILILGSPFSLYAWPRLGAAANIVTQNAGDKSFGISVTVGTSTAVALYTGVAKHREITLQNPSTSYFIYVGTHSALNASSGPRAIIPKSTTERPGTMTTNGTATIYGIVEGAAGANTIEVLGWGDYDSKD